MHTFVSNLSQRDQNMAQAFVELDTTNEVYLGQFGFAHTQLNGGESLGRLLNEHKKYHDKVLILNMYYIESGNNNPFESLADCQVFLYRFDPSGDKLEGFRQRGQWAIILKDQKRYSQIE
jgi:hypothetical protein